MSTGSIIDLPLSEEPKQTTIQQLILDVGSVVIENEVMYNSVTRLYNDAKTWRNKFEAKRKELTEPHRKEIASINDHAKKIIDPLDQIIELANDKVDCYKKLLDQKKEHSDEKLRAAAALFDAEEELYIPPMESNLRGDGAMAITKTEKKFKVVDISKVPTKYLMVDEMAIKRDLKLGINEIPGLEIYTQQTTQLRKR